MIPTFLQLHVIIYVCMQCSLLLVVLSIALSLCITILQVFFMILQ